MAISWGSNRGWKISPVILGTSRIVNSNESPAFKGIRQTRTLLRSTRFKDSQHQVRALETTLRDLFQGYIASPLDEDSAGNTLLYEVLKLVCVHNLEDVSRSVGFAGPEYLSLIRYLLDSGANPNVLQSPNKADFFVMGGGTALDMSAWSFVSATNRQTRTTFGHATYLQLVKDGGYFSRAIDGPKRRHPIHWFQNFKTEFRIFQQFAEQSEVHGSFTELIIAIIQQSESDLKREIFRCDVNHVSPENGLSAIHFAIYWPLALRELINAGANVNCQDHYGRRPVHLAVACGQREAVEILIAADCSLFTPHYSNSLLQESLRNGRDFDQTTNVIVDALVSRHTRLVNLALSTLPDTSELKTQLIVGTVWEIMAPQIANELAACNQQIPAALKLHRDGEGVYDTAELHADIRLTIPLAERLWRGGFLRINECAPLNGLTPILQAWYGETSYYTCQSSIRTMWNSFNAHWFLSDPVSIILAVGLAHRGILHAGVGQYLRVNRRRSQSNPLSSFKRNSNRKSQSAETKCQGANALFHGSQSVQCSTIIVRRWDHENVFQVLELDQVPKSMTMPSTRLLSSCPGGVVTLNQPFHH
ncbi:hypothetical protein B0J13DRAFT_660603 [Dactylonectria estremocensis]|uniref:Ankyrin n=1 Tax=Dactylonectria estremocensis TaxID=1079267 RepID=A0A9P9F296_9HYPO|nr:hypothetical protein B0J13DRAFT_660603 [Dactylonectria estremocensis]